MTEPAGTGYVFAVTCPRCAGALEHEVSSRPHDSGMRATAVVRCVEVHCHRRWQIVTELVTCGAPPPEPSSLKGAA